MFAESVGMGEDCLDFPLPTLFFLSYFIIDPLFFLSCFKLLPLPLELRTCGDSDCCDVDTGDSSAIIVKERVGESEEGNERVRKRE